MFDLVNFVIPFVLGIAVGQEMKLPRIRPHLEKCVEKLIEGIQSLSNKGQ